MRQGEHKGKVGARSDVTRTTNGENKDTAARMKSTEGINEGPESKEISMVKDSTIPPQITLSVSYYL